MSPDDLAEYKRRLRIRDGWRNYVRRQAGFKDPYTYVGGVGRSDNVSRKDAKNARKL